MKSINVKNVAEFLDKSKTDTTALIRLTDISSELGEVSKEVLKASGYGRNTPVLEDNASFTEEYGDLLFTVLALGIENNIDPSEALEIVLNKYNKRLETKGHIGSGK